MDAHTHNTPLSALTDPELAKEVCAGNDAAFEEMTGRYKGLISLIASKYSAAGFDRADFMQEGLIALLSACKAYNNKEPRASFKNFAGVCINNRYLSVIRSTATKSVIPTDKIVPIEDVEISDRNKTNPENLIIEQENIRQFAQIIRDRLSELELKVLRLYLGGKPYCEIAEELSVSAKSVDNALQRIRKKLAY